jgi:hypothetical protein
VQSTTTYLIIAFQFSQLLYFKKIAFHGKQTDLGITEDALWKHAELKTVLFQAKDFKARTARYLY